MKQMAPMQQHAIPVAFSVAPFFSPTPEIFPNASELELPLCWENLENTLIFKLAIGNMSLY